MLAKWAQTLGGVVASAPVAGGGSGSEVRTVRIISTSATSMLIGTSANTMSPTTL
jgi:hypothetical protein